MHDYYVVVVTHNSYVHIADVKLKSATNKKKTPFCVPAVFFAVAAASFPDHGLESWTD